MDFVLAWVDNHDPQWRKAYDKYSETAHQGTHQARFRDWENLRYWFRGVEKFAPWVDQIHFITYGHLPKWLNTDHPKLNIVKHTDFIPDQYLPTFSSRTIELNFHRIRELAEDFVYFNDDMFMIDKTRPEFFFKEGKPCDRAITLPISGVDPYSHTFLSDILILNKYFKKIKAYREKPSNWLNWKYGSSNLLNILLLIVNKNFFPGFVNDHLPQAFKKSLFRLLWEKEPVAMHRSCQPKFRDETTVNAYLIRYWQLASNNFSPVRLKNRGERFSFRTDEFPEEARDFIRNQEKPLLCLNDYETLSAFEEFKGKINAAFDAILPDNSDFEIGLK